MCGFRGVLLLLHLTAVTGQIYRITARDGDDVTLPCTEEMPDQDQCSQTWRFTNPPGEVTEFVFSRIIDHSDEKSDRRSVSANCSLVIKKVTADDTGLYACIQRDGSGSVYNVAVVTISQHKYRKEETLTCSVSTYKRCRFSVKWEFSVKDVGRYFTDYQNSSSLCSASMTFLPSRHFSLNYKILACKVRDFYTSEVKNFIFSPYSSETQGGEIVATTAHTKSVQPTPSSTTTQKDDKEISCSALDFIMLAMRLVEIVLISVILARLINAHGYCRLKKNTGRNDEDKVMYANLGERLRNDSAAEL